MALGDFHAHGAGRLSTASDLDFVAVTDERVAPESPGLAVVAGSPAAATGAVRTRARPVWTLAFLDATIDSALALPG